jgi:hypothetical protein
MAHPGCPAQRLEWLRTTDVRVDTRGSEEAGLRIVFPDPNTVIELDPNLPSAVQQLAIDVEAAGPVTVLVDGLALASGAMDWTPTLGHHVVVARSGALASEPVEIDVVRSTLERLP